jgi:hypothetical protein
MPRSRQYTIIVEGESKIQTTIRLPPVLNNRIQRVILAYKQAAMDNVPALEPPTQTWVYERIFEKGLADLEKELNIRK